MTESQKKEQNQELKQQVIKKLSDAKRITSTFLKRVENS